MIDANGLTLAQRSALLRLRELSRPDEARERARRAVGLSNEWFATSRFCRTSATAYVLERHGLVELRFRAPLLTSGARLSGSAWEARLTDAGRTLAV